MLDNFLKDLAELVNRDCGSANTAGVTEAALIMKRHYESIGFKAELVDLGPKAGKGLFATNKPEATHYDILLNAHLDTVFPDGTAAERPFRVEDGRATGPGCADCKGGVLAIYYALKNARPEDLARLSIAVCHNPDEETGSLSSKDWLAEAARRSSCAVVCEPGRPSGAGVRSRKGRTGWTFTVHGVAAHAGNNPQDGRSAILAAAHLTIALSALQDLEGKGTSLNVGVVHGGTVTNTVADTCTLEVETRYWTDEDGKAVNAAIEELSRRNWGDGVRVQAKRGEVLPAMPYTAASAHLIELVNRAAREAGYEPEWVDAGGGSDANHIARIGTPVVDGVGPAGGGFHSAREYLLVDTIESRVRMLSTLLGYL